MMTERQNPIPLSCSFIRGVASVLCAAILALVATGCSKTVDEEGALRIRIANNSSYNFQRVLVMFPNHQEVYGNIAAGEVSGYRAVDSAYRYAYVELGAGGRRLVFQPIDYVGETLLEPGSYTYVLTADPDREILNLEMKRD